MVPNRASGRNDAGTLFWPMSCRYYEMVQAKPENSTILDGIVERPPRPPLQMCPGVRRSVAMTSIFCYREFMAQANSISKLAGSAGTLFVIVGLLTFFSAILGFAPKIYVVVGAAIIALAFVAFFVQEFGPRR